MTEKQCIKTTELLKLAKLRQSKVYEGFWSIGDEAFGGGAYECEYVSPYSKSAHNVNADVMVILKDWSSYESLKGSVCEESVKQGYTSKVPTNTNLINLLKTHLSLTLDKTYTTNLFPYIKGGGMSGSIRVRDVRKAAEEFTIPMIRIIQPKIAIALGMEAFNALRVVSGLKQVGDMKQAVESSFSIDNTEVFFQTHPSQQSQNTRNRLNKGQVDIDWVKMKKHLNEC